MPTKQPKRERKPKSKVVKPNDTTKSGLTRFTDIVIPKPQDRVIKPEAIFDGFNRERSRESKKKEKKKTRSGKKY